MQPNNDIKQYVHLHFIIFIWGFTAVLGALISLDALPLVWYRLSLTIPFLLVWFIYKGISLKIDLKTFLIFAFQGFIIAVHWLSFFHAIKISNVSVTLITLSTGAFFTALIEPLFFKRRIIIWEILSGLLIVGILYFIFRGDKFHVLGMLWALLAAITSSIFAVANGIYVKTYNADVMSFYEFATGAACISIFLLFTNGFTPQFFDLSSKDWIYLLILSGICTAYAGVASIRLMKYISPFTIMLSINMEPVYGILLALLIFGDSEKMTPAFYIGAVLILIIVLVNSFFKIRSLKRAKSQTI